MKEKGLMMRNLLLVTLLIAAIIPNYWQAHIDQKVNEISAIQADFRFGFITDTHYKENHGKSGELVREMIERLHLPFFVHGGDAVSNASKTKEAALDDVQKTLDWFEGYEEKLLFVEGNHELMPVRNNPRERYDLRKSIHAHNEKIINRVKGDALYSYYYQDYLTQKIRFIILNSSDYDGDYRHAFSNKQLEWFKKVSNIPKDWSVIVISHVQPFYYNNNPLNGAEMAYVLEERKREGTQVIGWFSGHQHQDRINHNKPKDISFNIIEILNDDWDIWEGCNKEKGTITEQAFDIISINKSTGNVTLTRIGAGSNRSFNYQNTPKDGWSKIGNKWYYHENGLKTGWVLLKNKWYYLDPATGEMQTGWLNLKGIWYYLNPNGDMRTGWLKDNARWYYLNPSGAMKTGWLKNNGKWYYLNPSNGAMRIGWLKYKDNWYYLDINNGTMLTGWQKIQNKWYYFYANGDMAHDTLIGKYYVNKDGVWVK